MQDRQIEIERETHHPIRRKMLICLAESEAELVSKPALTKSDLAKKVFGRADGSARAMVTRMTAVLVRVGVIEERLAGRERLVRLTPRGRVLVRSWSSSDQGTRAWDRQALDAQALDAQALDAQALDEQALANALAASPRAHANDRPRVHLRHAASLALAALRQRGLKGSADEHFEQVLLGLIDENSSPERDLDMFYRLQRSWPGEDHKRILLAESIVRFQDESSRRSSAQEFLLVGAMLEPDADAVLWASGAIDIAHHYLVEPRSYLDQVTARSLLHTATKLMERTSRDPDLAIASAYRLAKTAKVATGGWVWRRPEQQPGREPRSRLEQEIARTNEVVLESAEFNEVLDELDRLMSKHLGRWIIRSLPKAEVFFRRTGGPQFSRELEDWAKSERGLLADVLHYHIDANMRRDFEGFLSKAQRYSESSFKKIVKAHLNQARALRGEKPIPEDPEDQSRSYSALVLNNLWTPEMVAADVIVERSVS